MYGDRSDRVSTHIAQKLSCLSDTFNEQCIFKVNDTLRSHNKQAYEPKVLSIGPYHHGKSNLKTMETYKLRYLKDLLLRCGEKTADRYIVAVTKLEDRARKCYTEEISHIEDDFVEMMCLDGCFILEFLRRWDNFPQGNQDDPIFQKGWFGYYILRDLILFENQVPFFILIELFEMTKFAGGKQNLVHLALSLCQSFPLRGSRVCDTRISANEVVHLLDLVHKGWCSSFAAALPEIKYPVNDFSMEFIKSTTELQQSGIKFGITDMQNQSWLDIAFKNGQIKIPPLRIEDRTESVFRNLIAYEQYMCNIQSRRCVTDYITFLDLLIDSARDVEKLRHCKIITNFLGDDEAVATMFNKLSYDVLTSESQFCYKQVFKEVNEYSSKRWNIWRAHLMRNYFNNPWSIISFLAAVVLLVLTLMQTIFSIL